MSRETIRVLSIEDNAADARLIREMLGKASRLGWDLPRFVLSHADGLAAGLARLDKGSIDVVLADLDLPDSQAGDTFARLRAHAPCLPIVVLTGREDHELAQHTVRAGAEDYLFKGEMNGSLLAHALLYAIERQQAKTVLQQAHEPLERQVQVRTAELEQANVQLRRRTELLDAILDNIPVMIVFHDQEGPHRWANRCWQETTGWSLAELQNQDMLAKAYPDPRDRQHVLDSIQAASGTWQDFRMRARDGRVLDTLWSDVALPDGFRIGIGLDITERKRAEEALHESEEKYRHIVENMSDVLWIADLDMRITYVTPSIERLVGVSPEQYMTLPVEARHPPSAIDQFQAVIAEEFEQEKDPDAELDRTRLIETQHYHADGSLLWIAMNVSFVRDAKGQPIGFQGISRDITERKWAVEALRDERQRLAGILRGTNAGTWEWNVQTGETIFNERWAGIIGYTLAEISPVSIDTWIEFCHPDDLRASDALLKKHFAGELDYYEFELRMKHKDGSWVWVLDRGRVVSWTEDGKPLMMMGTHQNITKRKRAEEDQEKLRAQLAQAQKMESVGRLAGGVAHDFNNMLGAIIGHAELALQQVEPGGMLYDDLEEIRQAARRSAGLTRQLLAFARKQMVAPKVLDLNTTLDGMLKMLRRLIGEAIELAWMPGEGLWPVEIDPGQLDQVLVNLCVNARDAIDGVGTITIETKNAPGEDLARELGVGLGPGDCVLLAVSDDGCGMEQEVLAHLFEPYYTTKEVGQGTGLGLATVYGIVEMNGGLIRVSSEPGRGTRFKIYLPRSEAQIASQRAKSPGLKGGRETVLFVEDEPANLRLGKTVLEQLGYTVLVANRPSEALSHAQAYAGEIDLLVTDVVMPEMNGLDLAAQIAPLNPGLRCLFISGYTADMVSPESILDMGGWFLQKPFSINELATKVREALERRDEPF